MGDFELNARQKRFARLVADGMSDSEAVLEAGYAPAGKKKQLLKLRDNARVQSQIEYYRECVEDGSVANKLDRERFWTKVMNDPSFPPTVRLRASEHLGKAQGDFVNNSKIEHTSNAKPVILIPESSPKEWEEYWERNND